MPQKAYILILDVLQWVRVTSKVGVGEGRKVASDESTLLFSGSDSSIKANFLYNKLTINTVNSRSKYCLYLFLCLPIFWEALGEPQNCKALEQE